jgi:hypothetical protein
MAAHVPRRVFAKSFVVVGASLAVASCNKASTSEEPHWNPPPPTEADAAPASPASAAASSASPSGRTAAARSIPTPDLACAADADCVVMDEELVDAPPNTYACCPGCTSHTGNKTWKAQFDAACKATPAPMCPPIGCAMPVKTAACVAKKCTLR